MRGLEGIFGEWRRIRTGAEHGLLAGDSVVSALESALDLLTTLRLVRARPTLTTLRAGIQLCDRAHTFIAAITPLLLIHPATAGIAFRAYSAIEVMGELRFFFRLLLRVVTWLRARGDNCRQPQGEEFAKIGPETDSSGDISLFFNEFTELGNMPDNHGGSLNEENRLLSDS